MPTCPQPRSTPAPTPKPNAKPSRAPTSRSPPNPCPTGQQTKISSNGSTASASNTIGLCGRNEPAWLCCQRRSCFRPHNPAVHIMAEDVRADAAAGAGIVEAGGVAAHDLVDAEAGERLPACREDRGCGAGCRAGRLEQRAEQFGGLPPQRAGPPLVALAVQADHRVLPQIEMPGPEIGRLLRPCPGVVEEQQQGPVPQRQPAVAWQPAEQLLDRVA